MSLQPLIDNEIFTEQRLKLRHLQASFIRPYQIDYMFHGQADYKINVDPGGREKNKNKKMNLIKKCH